MSEQPPTWKTAALWTLAAVCCLPWVTPPLALFGGLVFALFVGNVDPKRAAKVQKLLLQISVVGLGFGIQFDAVIKAGSTGVWATALSLAATMTLGLGLARLLKVERTTGALIATGTAICGGSAIAAMGPVLGAQPREMSVSLGCVFILNAIALFLFPFIGHSLGMNPEHFGYWSAIAIHDTSSVVGAAAKYGPAALATAVPVKLARALWILPMVAVAAMVVRREQKKAAVPWFIFFFILASIAATFLPAVAPIWKAGFYAAKAGLAATLFLIGAGLSKQTLKSVGVRPLVMAVTLWLIVAGASLAIFAR